MRISKKKKKKPAQSLGTTEMPEEVVAVALENCERDSVAALAQDAVSVSMRVEQDQGASGSAILTVNKVEPTLNNLPGAKTLTDNEGNREPQSFRLP